MMWNAIRRAVAAVIAAVAMSGAAHAQQEGRSAAAVCLADGEQALDQRLLLDGIWSNDRMVGAMNQRMARAGIATNSFATLKTGLARYRSPTALLVTFAADDGACAWVVSAHGVEAYERSTQTKAQARAAVGTLLRALDVRGASLARAPRLRTSAAAPAQASTADPAAADAALATVTSLVAPGAIGATLGRFEQVFVAPDETFLDFPFAMLPVPDGRGGVQPLVEHAAIQIAPSLGQIGIGPGVYGGEATDLARMTPEARFSALSSALVIGDPAFADREYLADQLPGAAEEARQVAAAFGVTPLSGEEATLAAVSTRLAARPRYVHIASHGLSDPANIVGNNSFIMLANGDRLTARGLSWASGTIIVLSACQSGLGASRPGGIVSLPRAFQTGGAQTVVMSLWDVGDRATQFMMATFAEELMRTGRPAQAHALAVRATRARYPNPRAWASFAVFGAGQF